MQAITRFFIDRWQFTLILFVMLFALGVASVQAIPKSEDPIVKFPGVGVFVVLPGADAEQMERVIAIPIETALNGIEDVDEISSNSSAGLASISVQFEYGTDPEKKYDEVVRELNVVRPSLPAGIAMIRADRANPAQTNIVQMALVSETAPIRQMEAYAREMRDAIERAPGVQQSEIWGVPTAEVRVTVDLDKIAAYQIPLGAITEALEREGADLPIGAVESSGRRFNVEATGPFDSLDEIRDVVLRANNGMSVRVGDVANVEWTNDEAAHITRYNGQRALFVTARAKLGTTIFNVIDGVKSRVDAFEKRLPPEIKLERGFDQSETVAHRLNSLGRDLGIAIALVLLTLLPLGFRASIIVMVSIPFSFAIGVTVLNIMGYSLNQLSIAGFVLALGLLVVDSIVVTENISRHLRSGLPPREAALAGVKEINVAVLGCTAALLLAFVPLLNLPESAGDFTRSLPMAVVCTIAASLFVALSVIPFLASRMLPRKGHSNIFLDVVMGAIHAIYRPILHLALSMPRITIVIGLALFAATLTLVPKLGFSLFPENDSPYFIVRVELPQGVSVSETDRAVSFADAVLAKRENITWRFSNAGRGNPRVYYNEQPSEQSSNVGDLYVRFDHWEAETGHAELEAIRKELAAFPGARFNVKRFLNGPPIEAPIAVRIRGADINVLTDLAGQVERLVSEADGTRNVRNPLGEKLIDLDLNVDTEVAALRGVPAGAIDQTLRIAIGGARVASFRDPVGDAYPVVVRAPRAERMNIADIERLYIWTSAGVAAPISEFADPSLSSGPSRISRYNRERTVTVTAFTQPGRLAGEVTEAVAAKLAPLKLPPGYSIAFGGEAEAQSESFGGFGPAIIIACFGILAVLLLEFGSFSSAAVVAFVIPFGIMGGLIALYIGKESLSYTSIIGFIALVGIEIKNSILLVEFANQERARGTPLREAIERAGEVRFLPVLLTSLTAIGGLIPLVLERSPLYSPLAMVIIGGLISSTLLARIVTPPLYLLLAPGKAKRQKVGPPATGAVATPAE
ncbi:MAG: efflux RND transporter permease subunit [Hyphomonadaceae bacterium]|nr:efflux RND transporter permease subunit [Hyphomonadaceae bacterium]